jgi:pyridoxal phosphate-dependent aminotransferase EpsN
LDPTKISVTADELRGVLAEQNIESRPLWKPMHLQPVYSFAPYFGSGVSEELFARGLCLPSGSDLTEGQLKRIVGIIRKTLGA